MKKGFTLSEVLIMLGIIGIVASMTLPNLVGKYQKKQTAIRLKYSLNIINNAFKSAVADYGDMKNWDYIDNFGSVKARKAFVDKYLIPYVKNAKPSPEPAYDYNGLGYPVSFPPRQPNGSYTGLSSRNYYPVAMLSGIYFYSGVSDTSITFSVDLNGKEKPNIYGRDLFVFTLLIDKNTVRPVGYNYPNPMSFCTKGNAWACAAAIEKNNWEIPHDYLW